MAIPKTKKVTGFEIPALGLGTWQMGGRLEPDYSNDAECVSAIKYALDLGYKHIDTAEVYAAGHAEELVGKAITDYDRSKLFITSKALTGNLRYDDVLFAAKNSLKRLRTDYLDLYLVHFPNPEIPIQETIKAFDELVAEGLVKHIGLSNFTVEQFKEAQDCTENKLVANQIEYSLIARNKGKYMTGMESEILPWCQDNDVIFMAWRPVAKGLLAKPNELLDEMAGKYGRTRTQIALNWLVSKKNVITMPKAVKHEHIKQNFEALDFELSAKDVKRLDEDFVPKDDPALYDY
ncbi:MAG: aldo/keto reductase [Candidatus Micrarchaeota archaeon]